MEFLDEDARPRFLFQARASPSPATEQHSPPKTSKLLFSITISLSFIFLSLSIFYLQSEPFRSILLWIALSLLVGPFAPISLTGGDIRVGQGPILEFPNAEAQNEDDTKKRAPQRRSKPRRAEENGASSVIVAATVDFSEKVENKNSVSESNGDEAVVEENEWIEEDIEILKKQMAKHPVGKPKRWEAIAEAFRGRHKVESVIKMAKELAERKVSNEDSYVQFLKKRKPVDKRIEGDNEENERGLAEKNGGEGAAVRWSSGEDIALLNALKAFPKDVPMRWEKIAAAVPGKSKVSCMKRVAELKRDFRNSKAANGVE